MDRSLRFLAVCQCPWRDELTDDEIETATDERADDDVDGIRATPYSVVAATTSGYYYFISTPVCLDLRLLKVKQTHSFATSTGIGFSHMEAEDNKATEGARARAG